jgi:hypothetical protein
MMNPYAQDLMVVFFFKKKLVPHPSLSFSKIKMCTFTPFKINVDFFSESLILDVTVLTRIV